MGQWDHEESPQEGQLCQCHLQPGFTCTRIAAEDVKHHGEAIQHLHAPCRLQLLLQQEGCTQVSAKHTTMAYFGSVHHFERGLVPEGLDSTWVGVAKRSTFRKTAVISGDPRIVSRGGKGIRGLVLCSAGLYLPEHGAKARSQGACR